MHMGDEKAAVQPTIFVFDPDGKFIRAFGEEFHGGGHGIEVRREGNEEFIYACSYKQVKGYSKMTLKGETIWNHHAPMEAKVYGKDEDTNKSAAKGRDKFQPTNFAFMPDGGFLLADGYGSYYIHRFDKDGKYMLTFGGPEKAEEQPAPAGAKKGTKKVVTLAKEPGKFNCPHGLWVDTRNASEPTIVVTDRANDRLQILDMNGKHKQTIDGFGLPANIDTWKDLMLVPELGARVSILNGKNEVVARLGDGIELAAKIKKEKKPYREMPSLWEDGKFVHPHDACFDPAGNIYVAEWVKTGRISKMKRLS
jgi:hypothetical protein